ncbi:MAG: radical SAM protein, partial [Deltaproteobacteria bacterium]|nr:radical SAM protein [Deltaproteobacteria bacterium]
DKGYVFGRHDAPVFDLLESLPGPEDQVWTPERQGMAYMETGRGCPMKCSYCRYPQMRRRPVFLSVDEVIKRVRILRQRGSNQIRFIDPTFNANPDFREILAGLKLINSDRHIRFFAELHADMLDGDDINDLAEAGFSEIEVGVQSRDRDVLRLIHRPTGIERLEKNIRIMTEAGIRVTVDLMYGLPGQSLDDVTSSFEWAGRFKSAYVQCMQTLLLPGAELRKTKDRWDIRAGKGPPYGVRSTSTLSPDDICMIEEMLNEKGAGEAMTRRFAGYRLPDLFRERVEIWPDTFGDDSRVQGRTSKRALIFRGHDLYLKRNGISNAIRRAIAGEPHALWQFVIRPEDEEPLDLLEEMIREIRKFPLHWLDRFAHASCWVRIASRRVFVHLKNNRTYSREWIQACEELLEDHFY